MNVFTILSIASALYCAIGIYQNPKKWIHFIQFFPIIGFMAYARLNEMTDVAWINAFNFGGLLAVGAILISIHKKIIMDRLFLGVNFFLLLGACGFLFDVHLLVDWYSATNGGPFFSCIAAIGLLTTLFTKTGFLGKKKLSKDAVRYGSFLLLAATVIALIWSVKTDHEGLLWATIAPFILLQIIQHQLIKHLA